MNIKKIPDFNCGSIICLPFLTNFSHILTSFLLFLKRKRYIIFPPIFPLLSFILKGEKNKVILWSQLIVKY